MHLRKKDNQLVVVLEKGESILPSLKEVAEKHNFYGFFSGIGAVKDPTIGYYNTENEEYQFKEMEGEYEVVSLLGNISQNEGERIVHAHIALGNNNYRLYGGHLKSAQVAVILETLLIPSPKVPKGLI